MRKNVVILTSGLSGSSVITGLIARGGYWVGESTFKKPDYETFENEELIHLDKQLFREGRFTGNYAFQFSRDAIDRIAQLWGRIDSKVYQEFVDRCNQHRPWVWKDPRLWMTIRYWTNVIDLEQCTFVLLSRDLKQAWISSILRRQITTYRYARDYEEKIRQSLVEFLRENRLPYLDLKYEDLIEKPVETIAELNAHLGSNLSVDDLKAIYKKGLFKSPRYPLAKQFKAMLIYFKNYPERLDVMG